MNQPMTQIRPVPAAAPAPVNSLAAVAFVLSLLGFSLIPVILGHIALGQIRRRGESGTAFAVIGLVLGYLELIAIIVLLVVLAGGIIYAVTTA
ncbi:DUF4190 domain-containing protein [Microbacterium nymphoidis]|uniref:DUF4190 domain-containing protein n=1 Tax=Microbacterium nymphoidis TaxID=2898586 RepID=UPI001E5DC925|nr:DUF4190 domain-containing protein [Microbacterium nymphoidis]MCD2497108.1 DUF4190 domain-containing protein [Microbacterium nymphoidis]